MKQFFTILFAVACIAVAHAQVQDDFSDGDFTNNPAWTGDPAKFEVNAALQLHLNAPAVADTAYLTTLNSSIDNVEWIFYFKLDFAPSSSNYLKVYLVSDQPNLKQPLNGYYLKMGVDGSNDAIELYRQQGTSVTLLMSGIAGHVAASVNTVSVKVMRDNAGNWEVYSDISGGTNFTLEGTVSDNTFTTTQHFGFFCKYTSSRSTAFYFDNVFVGVPVVDVDPPMLVQATANSATQIDLLFNEPVEQTSAENASNYVANNGIGNPVTAIRDATSLQLVHLTFPNAFPNGITNTITASNISDLSGNIMLTGSADFAYYTAQPNDIIINEIMADPDPPVALPSAEYAELYNQSNVAIDLKGWTFSDASSTQTLGTFVLQPNSYVILCDDANASLFTSYGSVLQLTAFPSLNNTGDDLTLRNPSGGVINSVSYSSDWYKNILKADGGWSLELIDPNSPCQGINNWIASTDPKGGTPGKQNSVFGANPDTVTPRLSGVALLDLSSLQLTFSESLDSAVAAQAENYNIDPLREIVAVTVVPPDFTTVALQFSPAIDSNVVYTLTVNGVSDCSGNVIADQNTAQFAIPGQITAGAILINEILFNPISGGSDYLEIYNNTDKILDLKDLQVASTNADDSLINIKSITSEGYLFFPGQYMVLTANPTFVKQNYTAQNPDWFIEMTLPSFNDGEGVAVLVNTAGERIDQLHYYDSWQFPLIDDVEGVALERIYFDSPTQDSLNWHSAASTVGYGTPTYRNSQAQQPGISDEITISPVAFSPDQDGHNDVLSIEYKFDHPGYVANVRVFDDHGRPIRDLVHSALLDQSGIFTWDGITDKQEKAAIGMYIIYVEIFDLDGKVKKYKKVCVVAAQKS